MANRTAGAPGARVTLRGACEPAPAQNQETRQQAVARLAGRAWDQEYKSLCSPSLLWVRNGFQRNAPCCFSAKIAEWVIALQAESSCASILYLNPFYGGPGNLQA